MEELIVLVTDCDDTDDVTVVVDKNTNKFAQGMKNLQTYFCLIVIPQTSSLQNRSMISIFNEKYWNLQKGPHY